VQGVEAQVPVKLPGVELAVYPVIAEPPLEAGAEKAMEAVVFPGVAVPMVGAPGTVAHVLVRE
jgi:hypothetical protein